MTMAPTVAIGETFLEALFKLPKDVQKKSMAFLTKFRQNPMSSGINYETIQAAFDKNLRSVRIDQAYRAIVLKPAVGAVYVLLFVGHHDDAYDWACRKRVAVHPVTGTIQILPVNIDNLVEPSEANGAKLFDHVKDSLMAQFGVPADFVGPLRECVSLEDFKQFEFSLPAEAYEAMHWLAEGESPEEVWRALMRTPDVEVQVDTEDVAAALERPSSKRHFKVVENDAEIEELFELARWRVFLHEVQHKVAYTDRSGPTRVLGGAGTGKTVVAMHRAKHLAETLCTGTQDRILFTTYTRNLATDIRQNLELLCGASVVRDKIEVQNLDAWVSQFLRKNDYPHEVAYFGLSDKLREAWVAALGSAPQDVGVETSFYREEWERVIQAQGIDSLRDYLKAQRAGRGVSLHRTQRMAVWKVFEEYRRLLEQKGLREAPDAMRDATVLIRQRPELVHYRAVIVDEGQDFGNAAYQLIRALVPAGPNDIFIVGDAHQRIYKERVTLSRCGVQVVGRSFRLRINYRTTDEIRRFALGLLEGVDIDDLDEGKDSSKGYMSHRHGPAPEVVNFKTFEQEVDCIVDFLGTHPALWRNTCVVAYTNKQVEQYLDALEARGFQCCWLKSTNTDDRELEGVRVATMHRVKGLEFDRMVLAGVNDGVVPRPNHSADEAVREDDENADRALLYVALTRARSEALVTSHGKPSRLWPKR